MKRKDDPSFLRQLRERSGRRAENAAALWLQLKGYRILEWRARTPACEIDIVAFKRGRPRGTLVFAEVKARQTEAAALESVTPQLRQRLEQAANIWVSRHPKLADQIWRFDIVLLSPGKLPRHMRDAWRAQG